ncbi:MAG: hypothetical protein KAX70_05785, partial [Pseudomonas sp.]|nr:hypothetical protein [Pseudomonas sp.]
CICFISQQSTSWRRLVCWSSSKLALLFKNQVRQGRQAPPSPFTKSESLAQSFLKRVGQQVAHSGRIFDGIFTGRVA